MVGRWCGALVKQKLVVVGWLFWSVIAVTKPCITIVSVTREDGSVDTEFTGEQRKYADDDFVPKEMKAGGLVLIHGEVRRQSPWRPPPVSWNGSLAPLSPFILYPDPRWCTRARQT